jgi:large subunit ribosomal protein L21
MFAIIRTGGKQYRVQPQDVLDIEKLSLEKGQKVFFDQVLLIEDGEKTLIGTPLVENAVVRAEIIGNFKDKKVIIFKKKRRKQFKRKRGHRQELTQVRIEGIFPDRSLVSEKELAQLEVALPIMAEQKEIKEEKPKAKKQEKAASLKAAKPKTRKKAIEAKEKKEVPPKKKAVAKAVAKRKAQARTKE